MSTSPVKGKSTASKQQPNWLDQIGKAWNEFTAPKKAPAAAKPNKETSTKAAPPPAKSGTKTPAAKTCAAPLTMKSPHGSSTYCITKNAKGAGFVATDPQGRNTLLPINNLKDARKTLQPYSNSQEFQDRVARKGTQIAHDAYDAGKRTIHFTDKVGSALAHSNINGLGQLGEVMRIGNGMVRGVHGAVKGAPKYFDEMGALFNGSTKTSKRDVAAGTVSGTGKFLYGAGAGLIDMGVSMLTPGNGRDAVAAAAEKGQRKLDNGYTGFVKQHGVNTESSGYRNSSTTAQIVGTVVSIVVNPAKVVSAAKGGLTKVGFFKGGAGKGGVGKPPGLPAPASQAHPVEGLKQAVQAHKNGKLNNAQLNEAIAKANEAFKAQKGSTGAWSKEMKGEFVKHGADADGILSGAKKSPQPTPVAENLAKPKGSEAAQPRSTSSQVPKQVKLTRKQPRSGNPITNPQVRASMKPVREVKLPDGSVRLQGRNGSPATLDQMVNGLSKRTVSPAQLKKAGISDVNIQRMQSAADAMKPKGGNAPGRAPGQPTGASSANTVPHNESVSSAANPGQKLLPPSSRPLVELSGGTGSGGLNGVRTSGGPVRLTRSQPRPGNPIANRKVRESIKPVRVAKNPDGSVGLQVKNGRRATIDEVVSGLANKTLNRKHLEQAGISPKNIEGLQTAADAVKRGVIKKPAIKPAEAPNPNSPAAANPNAGSATPARNRPEGPEPAQVAPQAAQPQPAVQPAPTRSQLPVAERTVPEPLNLQPGAAPGEIARSSSASPSRVGGSQEVPASLGKSAGSTPPTEPQLQPQRAPQPTGAHSEPVYAERPTPQPLDLQPGRPPGELIQSGAQKAADEIAKINSEVAKSPGITAFETNPGYYDYSPFRDNNCYNAALAADRTFAGLPSSALPSKTPGTNTAKPTEYKYEYKNEDGFDKTPLQSANDYRNLEHDLPNSEISWDKAKTFDEMKSKLEAQNMNEGARGVIFGERAKGDGHMMNFRVNADKKLEFWDAQTMTHADFGPAEGFRDLHFTRTDLPKAETVYPARSSRFNVSTEPPNRNTVAGTNSGNLRPEDPLPEPQRAREPERTELPWAEPPEQRPLDISFGPAPLDPTPKLDLNLPMGDVIFGKQVFPDNLFPSLPFLSGHSVPEKAPVSLTNPLTGLPIVTDEAGRLVDPAATRPADAVSRVANPGEIYTPPLEPGRTTYQRNGLRATANVGDYSFVVDVWWQKNPDNPLNFSDLPKIKNEGSLSAMERLAEYMSANVDNNLGWAIKAAGPAATLGQTLLGVNVGDYIEIGNLKASQDKNAILTNPYSDIFSRHLVNTVADENGKQQLVAPFEITVGKRAGFTPTGILGIQSVSDALGLPQIGSVTATTSRSSEIKVTLTGEIDPQLLSAINAGLNQISGSSIWHDQGAAGYRHVRQVNFALPGFTPREGTHSLPTGWKNLPDHLVPADRRADHHWSTYTAGSVTTGFSQSLGKWPGSLPKDIFGKDISTVSIGAKVGPRTERVEVPSLDIGAAIARVRDQGASPGNSQASPTFVFRSNGSSNRLTEELAGNVPLVRANGEWIPSSAMGVLRVNNGRPQVPMPGAVINGINGLTVSPADVPIIKRFLNQLHANGLDQPSMEQAAYEIGRSIKQEGQALSPSAQDSLRNAMRRYGKAAAP